MLYLVVYGDMKVASIVEKKMDSGYILNLVCYSLKQLLTYCAWFINSQENFSDSQQCLSFQMSVVLLMNKAEFSLPLGLHVYTPCQV